MLYRVEEPATPVIALADLKAHLRVDHSDEDDLIRGLERAAVAWLDGADGWLGRAMLQQTWELRLDDFHSEQIRIPLPPLISVDSVQYYDARGTLQTLSTSVYQVVGARNAFPGYVALRDGFSWPTVKVQHEAVIITFTCGYTINASPAEGSVPDAIQHAIKMLVGHWYANRESVLVGVGAQQMPLACEALLSPYRVHFFG